MSCLIKMLSDTLVRIMLDRGFAPCVCRDHEPSTLDRPALFLPIILVMFVSFGGLLALVDLPYGLQFGSLIPYTAFVALATFSAQRGQQPYFFECPIVRRAMPRLIRRHIGFLITIVIIETVALYLTRYMPASWLIAKGRTSSPFGTTLGILCICLAMAQIFTNRSLLERAHLDKQAGVSLGTQ
jgi:hypothetical protein